MEIKDLKKQIKDNKYSGAYLFCGEEDHLREHYEKELTKSIVGDNSPIFNLNVQEGKNIPLADVRDFIESYPVMADKKLLIIKGSGICKSVKAEILEFWTEVLRYIPDYLHIIFRERDIDKRSKGWKLLSGKCFVMQFEFPGGEEILRWVTGFLGDKGIKISRENCIYLVSNCDKSMNAIKREMEKLINYVDEDKTVYKKHIDDVVSKSVESRIFELTDAIISKEYQKSFEIIRDLKLLKQPVALLCYLTGKHMYELLFVKLWYDKGENIKQMATSLKKPPFVITKYLSQCRNITAKRLGGLVVECGKMDQKMKTGAYSDGWLLLEEFAARG